MIEVVLAQTLYQASNKGKRGRWWRMRLVRMPDPLPWSYDPGQSSKVWSHPAVLFPVDIFPNLRYTCKGPEIRQEVKVVLCIHLSVIKNGPQGSCSSLERHPAAEICRVVRIWRRTTIIVERPTIRSRHTHRRNRFKNWVRLLVWI